MEQEMISVVTLIDESGEEVQFDHLMTFEHEGRHYIALMPMEKVEGIGEEEVLILRINEDGDEETYEEIENEVLLEEVFNTFIELWEEEIEAEDDEDN